MNCTKLSLAAEDRLQLQRSPRPPSLAQWTRLISALHAVVCDTTQPTRRSRGVSCARRRNDVTRCNGIETSVRPITCRHDVIHTQRVVTPPSHGQMSDDLVKTGRAVLEICSRTDRQTHVHTHHNTRLAYIYPRRSNT